MKADAFGVKMTWLDAYLWPPAELNQKTTCHSPKNTREPC